MFEHPDADISIIAVTGLAGHAYGSWRHRSTKRMWLQDFLPGDLDGQARVLVYGYDSNLQGNSRSTAGMLDFVRNLIQEIEVARRPVRTLMA